MQDIVYLIPAAHIAIAFVLAIFIANSKTKGMKMTEQEFNLRYDILQLRLDNKIDSRFDTEKAASFLLDRDSESNSAFVGME